MRHLVRPTARLLLAGACALTATHGHAVTLYTLSAPTGDMATPGAFSTTFVAGAGAGSVSFQLQGYNTLDGDNQWIDILSFTLNGLTWFTGTWDLGGGGINRPLLDFLGTSIDIDNANLRITFTMPVTLAAGSNTLTIAYDSPTTFEGIDRAGPQGIGDEGWGLNSLTVSGPSPVPEPAGALLLPLGLAALALRRCAV